MPLSLMEELMFEIKEIDCISTQDKLLYNILECIQTRNTVVDSQKPQKGEITQPIGKCPICGKEWANNGQRLACTRKHKKEGKK